MSVKSLNSKELKKELIEIARRAGNREWCPGTSGNISILDQNKSLIYIKASGKSMSDVVEKDIISVDLNGNVVEGEGKPSKEIGFHLGLINAREDIKAVLHTHPPYSTAFATAEETFPMVTVTAQIILKKVPWVCYYPPGSHELADDVKSGFLDKTVKAVVCKAHGVVAGGSDLHQAYYINDWVEDAAKVAFLTRMIEMTSK